MKQKLENLKGESQMDFRTQCVIMALAGAINNDVFQIQENYQISNFMDCNLVTGKT